MKRMASAEECSENFSKRQCRKDSLSTPEKEWMFEMGMKFIIPDGAEIFARINDNLLPFGKSILYKRSMVAQVNWEDGVLNGLCVVADVEKQIIDGVYILNYGYVADKLIIGEPEERIVDLSPNGNRWEGSTLDGHPFGWGMYYDENGDLQYEGFRYFDQNVCFGEYFTGEGSDIISEYKGHHNIGEMMGLVEMKRNGESEWLCNEPIDLNVDASNILQVMKNGTRVREFIINNNIPYGARGPDYQCTHCKDIFTISYFSSLETLSITLHIQGVLRCVNICNCKNLRYLYIGNQSFHNCTSCLISCNLFEYHVIYS